MLAEDATLRARAREAADHVERVVADVNQLPPETQRANSPRSHRSCSRSRPSRPAEGAASAPERDRRQGRPTTRPYPSGPLHIGNARAFVLNDAYAKKYHGQAPPRLRRHDRIRGQAAPPGGLRPGPGRAGLGRRRVPRGPLQERSHPAALRVGGEAPLDGEAYVCECDADTLRKNREAMRACVHRIQSADETIAMWKAMLAGEYGEGEAVVRLKTDMADPNPAFRDRVLFRIAERDHRAWGPLPGLADARVLLGRRRLVARRHPHPPRQGPRHGGPDGDADLDILGFGVDRNSSISASCDSRPGIVEVPIPQGDCRGPPDRIDDPRTWSLQSLRRRGIRPAALRDFVLSFGLSLNDIEVPAETCTPKTGR